MAEEPRPFQVAPEPAWVESAVVSAATSTVVADGGARQLLSDHQQRVTTTVERFGREVYQVTSAAGVEQRSELRINFDPSYQTLTLHHARIIRNDKVIDALHPEDVKVLQRESDLDARIYDGALTAVIFLPDVRVGDVIDFAATVTGENPVLKGRIASNCAMGDREAIGHVRCRLLLPASRSVQVREVLVPSARVREVAGEREYVWEATNVPAIELEDETPSWTVQFPMVEWSEFRSWSEVATWATSLQAVSTDAAVLDQVRGWSKLKTEEERFLAALRFVQDDVRYLGIEQGPNSHEPHRPTEVLSHRFGDCKDKSLLLVSLLRALGIDATPAVVSTTRRDEVKNHLPSPLLFDHEIVQALVGGKQRWVDSTANYERGGVDQEESPPWRLALLVKADTTALTPIPYPQLDHPTELVEETFEVKKSGVTKLTVVTRYLEEHANRARHAWASESPHDMGQALLSRRSSFAKIRPASPPQMSDDPVKNEVTVREAYEITDASPEGFFELPPTVIDHFLTGPQIRLRKSALELHHPTSIVETVILKLPRRPPSGLENLTIEDDAVKATQRVHVSGKVLTLTYTLQTKADHVAAEDVEKHLELRHRIWHEFGGRLNLNAEGEPEFDLEDEWPALVVVLVIGLVIGVSMYWRGRHDRARRQAYVGRLRTQPGETPANAIPVTSGAAIAAEVARVRCICGNPYGSQTIVPQESVLAGIQLTSVRVKCGSCGTSRAVYFLVKEVAAARAT